VPGGIRIFHGRRLISYWLLRRSHCGSRFRENSSSSHKGDLVKRSKKSFQKCRSMGPVKRHRYEAEKISGHTTNVEQTVNNKTQTQQLKPVL
jgi:hypothetical protein